MAIITLTSDWGDRGFYVAAVKGKLLSALPQAAIVDISHQVKPHNIALAAFILGHSYREFPPGTVHIVSVNSTASIDNRHIALLLNGHYFVGADNGLFTLLSDSKPEKVIEIDIPQESDLFIFPGRDVFAQAAVHLARGKPMEELGFDAGPLKEVTFWKASADRDPEKGTSRITGRVLFVDNYGNCITNISADLMRSAGKGMPFQVIVPANSTSQNNLYEAYDDVEEGKMVALLSTTGFLEIAINMGNASQLLGLKPYESTVIVNFS